MRVAAIITNYNMPERAEALADTIAWRCKDCDVYLVDNGSDIVPPARGTNVRLEKNVQTTRGWLAGLKAADESGLAYDAYWFLITSAEFVGDAGDPLSPMTDLLADDPQAVGVHPALTRDSTTAWGHLITRGGSQPRQTWMIDNIASLYRASWFNAIGRFDPSMIYGWGVDLETCYFARQQGYTLWVHEGVKVKKVTNIGYSMKRMNMTADARSFLASRNMDQVLSMKYGPDWKREILGAYVTGEMR